MAAAYYLLLVQVTTLHTMLGRLSATPLYLVILAMLVPLAFVLFGANTGIGAMLLRARLGIRGQSGTIAGGALFAAGCPSCGAFLLSLIGVTAGLSALPFAGLEIWAGSSLLMAITLSRSMGALAVETCVPGRGCVGLPSVSAVHIIGAILVGVAALMSIVVLYLQHEPQMG
jgi:hypothetical protein